MEVKINTTPVKLRLENYSCAALVEIKDGRISLLRTLNPDASEPIQGEEYSSDWSLSVKEASKNFGRNGFWDTWTEINGKILGSVYLYDNLTDEDAERFIGLNDYPLIMMLTNEAVANWVLEAKPGIYVLTA